MDATTRQMGRVCSADGTPIAYYTSGAGPALVLAHGTAADHGRWAPVLSALEARCTVHAVDRRGRGGSGDAPVYALEREVEDLVAVVEAIGGPVALLGHSYGAICALEAAARTDHLRALILYEPAVPSGQAFFLPSLIERLEALLAAGDREAVLATFFAEVPRLSPAEIEQMRALPSWAGRLAAAHTIPRELRAVNAYAFAPARFRGVHTSTTLLLGSDSASPFRASTEAVHAALPASRIVLLPGQQHIAMNTAPALFLDAVLGALAAA